MPQGKAGTSDTGVQDTDASPSGNTFSAGTSGCDTEHEATAAAEGPSTTLFVVALTAAVAIGMFIERVRHV